MSSSTSQTTLNRHHLHRQTYQILNANLLHFIPISLLFLPLTFSACAAIKLYSSSSSLDIDFTTYFDPPTLRLIKIIIASSLSLKTLILVLCFTFFVVIPTVAGIALITYSTNQAIYSKRLTFSSAVKSLSNSFGPLLSTIIAGSVKLILISLFFTLFPIAIIEATKTLGFPFDLNLFSIFINSIVSYVIAFTVVYFIVSWGSGPAIAVLELKSGFKPLQQSANQSREFRSHVFSLVFFFGFAIGPMMSTSAFAHIFGSTTNWISILNVSFICLNSSLMIMHYAVANTVLYVQCKVACGDEIVKSAVKGKVSDDGEYAKVAVTDEDDKIPVDAEGGFAYTVCGCHVIWLVFLVLGWFY